MCDELQIGANVDNTDLVKDEYYDEDGIHFVSEFYPIWAGTSWWRCLYHDEQGSVTRTELFKYITVAVILVFVILMLIFASGSTKAFDEVAKRRGGIIGHREPCEAGQPGTEALLWS